MHCVFMEFGRDGWESLLTCTLCSHGVWAKGRGFGRESFDMHCVLCSWFVHPTVINNTS